MNERDKIALEIAKILLDSKAVFLKPNEPFTWASGIVSPIYCDNRVLLGDHIKRKTVEKAFVDVILDKFKDCEVLMGTSTAGIPHAAIIADYMALPMGYVRGSAKTHGRNNQIEGAQPKGKKVVVVEDLISTAGSSIEVVDVLREAGADVLGIVSIFTYSLKKGLNRLNDANVINYSLSDIHTLLDVAVSQKYITEKEKVMIEHFINNPDDPSWQNC